MTLTEEREVREIAKAVVIELLGDPTPAIAHLKQIVHKDAFTEAVVARTLHLQYQINAVRKEVDELKELQGAAP